MTASYPLVRLPSEIDYALYLIKEELKSTYFFNGLNAVGASDVYFQPNLGVLILKAMDMDDGRDETSEFLMEVIERRSRKINSDNDSAIRQAMKVYMELAEEKRRIKSSKKKVLKA